MSVSTPRPDQPGDVTQWFIDNAKSSVIQDVLKHTRIEYVKIPNPYKSSPAMDVMIGRPDALIPAYKVTHKDRPPYCPKEVPLTMHRDVWLVLRGIAIANS